MCENDELIPMNIDIINEILQLIQLAALVLYSCTVSSRREFKDKLYDIIQLMNEEEE